MRSLALVLVSAVLAGCNGPDEAPSTHASTLSGEADPGTPSPTVRPPFPDGTFVGKQVGTLEQGGQVESVERSVWLAIRTSGSEVTITGEFESANYHATTVDKLRFSTDRFFELLAPDGSVSGYGACVDAACVVEIARDSLSGTVRYAFDGQAVAISSELRLPGLVQRTTGRLERAQ